MSLWGQYEERVMLGCESFLEACKRNGFSGKVDSWLAKAWAVGMRDWLESMGEDWETLGRAVDYMRSQDPPLIIASPRSCIKVAQNMKEWTPVADGVVPVIGNWSS